jgi:superfamily II DNA or RNA helicase
VSDPRPALHRAVSELAARCDHASSLDGQGFNGRDASFGHSLAGRDPEDWTPRMAAAAHKMLRTYRVQLLNYGIDYDALPVPDAEVIEAARVAARPAAPPTVKRITLDDGRFRIESSVYDEPAINLIRNLPNRRFSKVGGPHWTVGLGIEAGNAMRDLHDKHGYELSRQADEAMAAVVEAAERAVAESRAEDAEVEVAGLGGTLMPFQRAGVAYAVRAKRCIIADEMGLGKTVQALAAIHHACSYPALVICPASLKLNWQREASRWLPGKVAAVLTLEHYDWALRADVTVLNYDVLARHARSCRFPKEDPEPTCKGCALLLALRARGYKALVVDEMHYVKNFKANRTAAVKYLAKQVPMRLGLTGTPVLNRPQELISPLGILGRLEDMGGFWHFAKRYCGAYQDKYGWNMTGAANLGELNDRLRASCFVRRRKADVLKELPAKRRAMVPVDIDNRAEYDRVEADVIGWCGARAAADAGFQASIAHLSEPERRRLTADHRASSEYRAAQAETLVRIEALKQVAAAGKVAAVVEWVGAMLETDEKLVLFATHRDIQRRLLAEFPKAARIFGDDDAATRQANVDRFQRDDDCRLIICSLAAAGVGLTLTAASNVAFVEFGWTPAAHDQAEDRCHRIGQTDSVTAWYLAAGGTIDDHILQLVNKKRTVVDAATDGATVTAGGGILNEVVELLTQGRAAHGSE